jgi:hypothetical protein
MSSLRGISKSGVQRVVSVSCQVDDEANRNAKSEDAKELTKGE